jgi:hypothetical protein
MVGVACLVVAAGSASAQTVRAGVKGGVALTSIPLAGDILDQISGTESDDVRAKVGVTGGGFVEFVLNERFSFQPELLFVMKGVQLDLPGETGQVTAALNYLEFPLLGRFSATLTDVLKGYIFVGPTFGVTVGTDSTFDSAAGTEDLNIDPAFERRDFGLTFGGGLERDGRYLIEARYNLGLADIATDIFEHDDALRNRAFSVMIGIRLP